MLYVDDMRRRATVAGRRAIWSHLYGDSAEELLTFAGRLGCTLIGCNQQGRPLSILMSLSQSGWPRWLRARRPSAACRRGRFLRNVWASRTAA